MKNIDEIRADLKKEMATLKQYEIRANELDAAYEAEPENEEIEQAFDEAYTAEYEQFTKCVEILVQFTGIEKAIAATMMRTQRTAIEAII